MKTITLALIASTFIDSLPTKLIAFIVGLGILGYIIFTVSEETPAEQSDNPIADATARDLDIEPWWNS